MPKTIHLHYDKAGLLIDVVKSWPVSWLTDPEGKPFATLREAVVAILDVPFQHVPMGCPAPRDDGSCPGHEIDAEELRRRRAELEGVTE